MEWKKPRRRRQKLTDRGFTDLIRLNFSFGFGKFHNEDFWCITLHTPPVAYHIDETWFNASAQDHYRVPSSHCFCLIRSRAQKRTTADNWQLHRISRNQQPTSNSTWFDYTRRNAARQSFWCNSPCRFTLIKPVNGVLVNCIQIWELIYARVKLWNSKGKGKWKARFTRSRRLWPNWGVSNIPCWEVVSQLCEVICKASRRLNSICSALLYIFHLSL